MTSDAWVWSYLPSDTQPTLCGHFVHANTPAGLPLGRFVYGKRFLKNPDALPLDPLQLRLSPRTYETTALQGVFGPLQDAMPDDWGRHVIERLHGGRLPITAYLLLARDDRTGNLVFSSSAGEQPQCESFPGIEVLEPARGVLRGIELDRPIDEQLAHWVQPNTAMGGARPKLTIEHEGSLWMAKFPARNDHGLAVAKLEGAMLALARLCGIQTVQAQVVAQDILLVKRFDRARVHTPGSQAAAAAWRRDAFVSARTVFYADPAVQGTAETGSYPRLATVLARCSEAVTQDRHELFRRMVFNCCVSNTDDHDRNHGLLAGDEPGYYRLSPAFDIVPRVHQTRRRYQALGIGDAGALVTRENLVSSCESFDLRPRDATAIIDQVQATVATNWRACLQEQGATGEEMDALSACFAPLIEDIEVGDFGRPTAGQA